MLHGITAEEAATLEAQVVWLRKHFELLRLDTLIARLDDPAHITGREVALTFDDGLRNNATVVAPLLAKHDAPATFFVCPGLIESSRWLWNHEARERLKTMEMGDRMAFVEEAGIPPSESPEAVIWEMKRLPLSGRQAAEAVLRERTSAFVPTPAQRQAFDMMSWEELRSLDPQRIAIGSHTVDHPILPTLDDGALEAQLAQSRAQLESALDRPVSLFCYPNGSEDGRVRAAVRLHYDAAVTTESGLVRAGADRHGLPRIGAPDSVPELSWRFHRP